MEPSRASALRALGDRHGGGNHLNMNGLAQSLKECNRSNNSISVFEIFSASSTDWPKVAETYLSSPIWDCFSVCWALYFYLSNVPRLGDRAKNFFTNSVKKFVSLIMALIEVRTNISAPISISPLAAVDHKKLTKRRYFFPWRSFLKDKSISAYKLQLLDNEEILGVMALCDFPAEKRIEIKLLACSVENVGTDKVYEGIAGHLIAYACRLALARYGHFAAVSLIPKTNLKIHYLAKYGMIDAGWHLLLEGKCLNDIAIKYFI